MGLGELVANERSGVIDTWRRGARAILATRASSSRPSWPAAQMNASLGLAALPLVWRCFSVARGCSLLARASARL